MADFNADALFSDPGKTPTDPPPAQEPYYGDQQSYYQQPQQPQYAPAPPPPQDPYYAQQHPSPLLGQGEPVYGTTNYTQQGGGGGGDAYTSTGYGYGGGGGGGDGRAKFVNEGGYRDPLFALLFVLHLVGLAVLMIIGMALPSDSGGSSSDSGTGSDSTAESDTSESDDDVVKRAAATLVVRAVQSTGETTGDDTSSSSGTGITPAHAAVFFFILLASALVSVLIASGWLALIRKFARQVIYLTLGLMILLCVGEAAIFFVIGSYFLGIVLVLVAFVSLIWLFLVRSRLEFAKVMLECVVTLVDRYPSTTYVSYASTIPLVGYLVFWTLAAVFTSRYGIESGLVAIFFIFSFFWSTQVVKNVVHVTVSGVFATWYFAGPENVHEDVTRASLKRACTTSFGSICFGSMLVAIIKTLRAVAQGVRSGRHQILIAIGECLLRILDRLVQYFNHYAFVQVAIYGSTFCEAASATWELFSHHGIKAIINDDITSAVLMWACVLGGCATALFGGLVAIALISELAIAAAFISFFIGFAMTMLTMQVVDSGVATIFTCFAENPDLLRQHSPELYSKMADTYGHECDFFTTC